MEMGMQLTTQIEELHAGKSRVETIFPPSDSEHLFGAHALDLTLRPAAARAGYDQGSALADPLSAFWH